MINAGLTPFRSLSAGTRVPGEFIAKTVLDAERFGTIEVGKRADLILPRANPLASVANVRKQLGIMVAGRWFPAFELNLLLGQEKSKLGGLH